MSPLVVAGVRLRRSLRLVIIGIGFGMVYFSITTGTPLTGFARKLGAGDFLYGILMALPVLGGVVQLFTAYLIEKIRRRKILFMASLLTQRLLWLPIACVPFLVPSGWPGLRVWTVIALLSLSAVNGSIGNVAFLSWMGDLVPEQIRGRFFSRRNTVSTITAALGGLAAGYYLDLNDSFKGFALVFSAAALFGAADILCFLWVDEPPMAETEQIRLLDLATCPFRAPDFRRFMFYNAAWSFAVNCAGPFFNVYMLEHLHLGYLQISVYAQLLGSLSTVLMVRVWGRLTDAYGSKPVLAVCCGGASVLPLVWILTSPGWPYTPLIVLAINFSAGVCWSGIDLCHLNLLLKFSPDRNRSVYVAGFNLFTTLAGSALAFVAGGLFLDLVRGPVARLGWRIFGGPLTGYHLLFVFSGLLRVLAAAVLLPGLREERSTAPAQIVRLLLGRGRGAAG
ncbi:MAG: MFS transporter [Bacteroidota bacterium]